MFMTLLFRVITTLSFAALRPALKDSFATSSAKQNKRENLRFAPL